MGTPTSKEWSRATLCRPKDNLTTEAGERAVRHVMVSTIEKDNVPNTMSMLIGMEYARIWLQDRNEFKKKVEKSKAKVIKNDIEWWLKLHKTNKCFCTI